MEEEPHGVEVKERTLSVVTMAIEPENDKIRKNKSLTDKKSAHKLLWLVPRNKGKRGKIIQPQATFCAYD